MPKCSRPLLSGVLASVCILAAARPHGPSGGAAHTIESASSGRSGHRGPGSVTSNACRRLQALGGGKKPSYFLVVARLDEDIAWVSQLPIPSVVYNLETNATLEGTGTGGRNIGPLTTPAAAFAQSIVDHYECLPPWTLFLSAHGRTSFSGSTERGFYSPQAFSSSAQLGSSSSRRPSRQTSMGGRGAFDGGGGGGGNGRSSNGNSGVGGSSGLSSPSSSSSGVHHPLPPATSSAVLDVGRMDAGFVAVGHLSEASFLAQAHPAVAGFALHSPKGSHRMAFVSVEEKRRGCSCSDLKGFLGKRQPCERPWGWPRGGEFWASDVRLRLRPVSFWRHVLSVLVRGEALMMLNDQFTDPFSSAAAAASAVSSSSSGITNQRGNRAGGGGSGGDDDASAAFPATTTAAAKTSALSSSSPSGRGVGESNAVAVAAAAAAAMAVGAHSRAACFETLWHHVLGEHLFHYQPPFEYFEAMPLLPFLNRCEDGRKRMSGVCSSLKVPHVPSTIRDDGFFATTTSSTAASANAASSSSSTSFGADGSLSQDAASAKCLATHGEMLGETLLVTTYAGLGLEDADHSCCRKCRATRRCSFWVRSTDTRECWLKAGFVGYGSTSNRRGMFISEFNGIFLAGAAEEE